MALIMVVPIFRKGKAGLFGDFNASGYFKVNNASTDCSCVRMYFVLNLAVSVLA